MPAKTKKTPSKAIEAETEVATDSVVVLAETPSKPKIKTSKPSKKPSKRYQYISKGIEDRAYSVEEATTLVKKSASAKFDETVEAHFRLGIDPAQTAQQVRGNVQLPHGTGKKVRTLVFATGPDIETALKAGATIADETVIASIEKGSIPFDLVLATPDAMPQIAKLARVLGVRGLMPNPRAGTVTTQIAETITARSQGLVDFKNDQALLHLGIGKASFTPDQLKDNFVSVYEAIKAAKPAKTSGEYIRSATITSTMGPAIKIDRESVK